MTDGGFGEGGITALEDALGLRPTWYNGGMETFGPGGSVVAAMLAVAAGLCAPRRLLPHGLAGHLRGAAARRRVASGVNPYGMAPAGERVAGFAGPYGVGSAANHLAMCASHHFARYGTTRETLGWIALNQRANAALNPPAIYREPLTMDDYLVGAADHDAVRALRLRRARPTPRSRSSSPRRDAAQDLRRPPVLVEAVGTQITERDRVGPVDAHPRAAGARPGRAPLDRAPRCVPPTSTWRSLYDGFTFNCLSWLEALGFCGIGEAKDFLDGGKNIARDGVRRR